MSGVICDRRLPSRVKGKVAVKPAVLYGLETLALTNRHQADVKLVRFTLGVTRMDKIRNEYIRGTEHVGPFAAKTQQVRLRWY